MRIGYQLSRHRGVACGSTWVSGGRGQGRLALGGGLPSRRALVCPSRRTRIRFAQGRMGGPCWGAWLPGLARGGLRDGLAPQGRPPGPEDGEPRRCVGEGPAPTRRRQGQGPSGARGTQLLPAVPWGVGQGSWLDAGPLNDRTKEASRGGQAPEPIGCGCTGGAGGSCGVLAAGLPRPHVGDEEPEAQRGRGSWPGSEPRPQPCSALRCQVRPALPPDPAPRPCPLTRLCPPTLPPDLALPPNPAPRPCPPALPPGPASSAHP